MTNLKNPGPWIMHDNVPMPEEVKPDDLIKVVMQNGAIMVNEFSCWSGGFDCWSWYGTGEWAITKYRLSADHPVYALQEPSLAALDYVARFSGWNDWKHASNTVDDDENKALRDHARLIEKHEPHRLIDPLMAKARELFAKINLCPRHDEVKRVATVLREWGVKP
jgi:hypothetical protein